MREHLLTLLWVVAATSCAEPTLAPTGEFESPCESSDDCVSGLRCLVIDGFGTCSAGCPEGVCPNGYGCRSTDQLCVPDRGQAALEEHRRCGPLFPPCGGGLACVEWEQWGPRCSRVCEPLTLGRFSCWSGCCAATTDPAVGVCAPPSSCF